MAWIRGLLCLALLARQSLLVQSATAVTQGIVRDVQQNDSLRPVKTDILPPLLRHDAKRVRYYFGPLDVFGKEERKANKRFLELETYGANGDFAEAIEKLGCECATTANRLKMILADGVEIRDIYRIAEERSVRIRRLNFRRDTLEDIFLKAMETSHAS